MYNEFEEYSLNTKMNFKVWKRIFKELMNVEFLSQQNRCPFKKRFQGSAQREKAM